MDLNGKKLILSSASPRRKELLAGLGVDFSIDTNTSFIEHYDPNTPLEEIPALMAEGKSEGFHRELAAGEILLTSDTMVYCDGLVMGKPDGREGAVSMLEHLSGKTHHVTTAVTLRSTDRKETVSDTAYVHFKELSADEISYYVDNYKPFDKAGAYGIQEWIGYIGITGIQGSYFTIMGLPVHLVYQKLIEFCK